MHYLEEEQVDDAAWEPLWFGNEHREGRGRSRLRHRRACRGLLAAGARTDLPSLTRAIAWLQSQQQASGGWGGSLDGPPSLEETSVTMQALAAIPANESLSTNVATWHRLAACHAHARAPRFPSSPIGLYFARLWYHEQLYPDPLDAGSIEGSEVCPGFECLSQGAVTSTFPLSTLDVLVRGNCGSVEKPWPWAVAEQAFILHSSKGCPVLEFEGAGKETFGSVDGHRDRRWG